MHLKPPPLAGEVADVADITNISVTVVGADPRVRPIKASPDTCFRGRWHGIFAVTEGADRSNE